ncbi:enoyl-CoA hydratase/isomerase family protein [Phaeobacter gallaeciensis]|jgi:2-(1,2-epoxy-1,2-dihydrophenyl)acetyl-CoA isomerase|uniref:enoyl-CoA hydratase/isomerase family protein n=1 Tax=Phaeobacter gallaeciensis TaxID=60890 RepID=UPI00237F3398|nr:enoyl-CoA hydratase/isomerase family protein [Phaeobacter gallaeciensis]MDE4305912.1 enoyl-CoA hydratase/isomerase family protein [Phaeobacter gallaeciensis]MDE4310261.1 enoyl-CoA hydratase/isomerase family protein [Phaeobacter gallaeciensis]MDE4314625.1 enoyl-CoA hydratase/isomerase family protein [Phaeobacter gallaeciensis]MDE4319190.1 enoyl-CoA hydratase/isomerase family protein [Phaeobacter gallaeciensis]MDE4323991.1 enoyl-CoA hydratase/isomerase family protein [Phaeobacter gallaeciensi
MANQTVPLRVTREGGIVLIELTRPEIRNPLNNELKQAMDSLVRSLEGDRDLTGVILTGTGGVFSGGGDVKAMSRERASGEYNGAEDYIARMRHSHGWLRILRELPVPVIAAVDGPCVGAGFSIALLCDFVLVTPRAKFAASFCKIGLAPDLGLFYTLPRAVGQQRAREIFYTGRLIGAEEALRLGLALEIVPEDDLLTRAWDIARQMEQSSPTAFALTKQISARALESDFETLLAQELQAQSILLASRYNGEAVDRFTAKEPPRFNFK